MEEKCASVAVVGRPSAGKSTLVNTICEAKVSITASVPQTTRNLIRGVYTDSRGQLIFTDTPGMHISQKDFNKRLYDIALASLEECDIVLYVCDCTREPGDEELLICSVLSKIKVPVVCCLNKKDICSTPSFDCMKIFLEEHLNCSGFFAVSALEDSGVDELLIELFKHAPFGNILYPPDVRTDQDLEFRISEIIREKTIENTRQEIPHSVFVEVSDLEYDEVSSAVWIRAFINTERDSQKAIIIGKGASNIKKIRQASFKEIKKIFPACSLSIDLRVRKSVKWKSNPVVLSKVLKDGKKYPADK